MNSCARRPVPPLRSSAEAIANPGVCSVNYRIIPFAGYPLSRAMAVVPRDDAMGPGCVRRTLYRRRSYRDIGFAITERQSAQNRLFDRPRRCLDVCRL
jgi:hypothetical protein